MSRTDYYRTIARKTYDKGICAWVEDLKAGRAEPTNHWAPAEYLIKAITVALAEERLAGFQEGERAGRQVE